MRGPSILLVPLLLMAALPASAQIPKVEPSKRPYDVSFEAAGHFERRQETWNEGKLAFEFPEPESFQDGVHRNWRKTYSHIEKDSFRWTWDYTEDGKTWTVRFVTDFKRLPENGST